MTRESDFPIELRHPKGGSILFVSIDDIINKFYGHKMTSQGSTIWPSDFHLYINGRQYNWSKECIEFPASPDFTWAQAIVVCREHLRYVMDIELSFYDVNTEHEDTVPESS